MDMVINYRMSIQYCNQEELSDPLASFFNEMKEELYNSSKALSRAYGFDFENDKPINESKFRWEIYSELKQNLPNSSDI